MFAGNYIEAICNIRKRDIYTNVNAFEVSKILAYFYQGRSRFRSPIRIFSQRNLIIFLSLATLAAVS